MNMIQIEAGFLEHLLNCLVNQRVIHEQNEDMQYRWQVIIDKALNDGMMLLSSNTTKKNLDPNPARKETGMGPILNSDSDFI